MFAVRRGAGGLVCGLPARRCRCCCLGAGARPLCLVGGLLFCACVARRRCPLPARREGPARLPPCVLLCVSSNIYMYVQCRVPDTTSTTLPTFLPAGPATSTMPSLHGWLRSIRRLKSLTFADLFDGRKAVPVVLPNNTHDALRVGQALALRGHWKQAPPTASHQQEFLVSHCSLLGDVPNDYPLQNHRQSLQHLRKWPLLKHRTNYLGHLLLFRSFIEEQLLLQLRSRQFVKVAPPLLTTNDCEGASNALFNVSPSNSYLTVSTQLHLEVLAHALNRVYSLGPCFRAERSHTTRHLLEFWMLELEWCFQEDLTELTNLVTGLLKSVVRQCIDNADNLLPEYTPTEESQSRDAILSSWRKLVDQDWPSIEYRQAVELLQSAHMETPFKHPPQYGADLQTEHEKWLAGSYFKSPVYVTNYPRALKAFYMKRNNSDTVACFDLLVPDVGEIVGGSLREEDYDTLDKEIKNRGMNQKGELNWYLELRKQGSVPHGGFGLGIERFVSFLYGNHNIRDAIPFARMAGVPMEL